VSLVVDASVVVAALVDSGEAGRWAAGMLRSGGLAAPHLMPVEALNTLRRAEATGRISAETAALAVADLIDLRAELFPFEPLVERAWRLRGAITACDAWYVALAEAIDAPLATLDHRLASAPGPVCTFVTPLA
jgi:predicted nucleic acid-binding protein